MKKYIALILLMIMVFLCCSCANPKENSNDAVADSTTKEITTEDASAKYMNSENCVINGENGYYEIPNEFKPFECSRDDYADFLYARIKDSFFSARLDNEWVAIIRDENDSELIFKCVNWYASDSRMAYIKDSLFFVAKERLYKLTVDESSEYENSDFSLVADIDAIPCFLEENKMYLVAYGFNSNNPTKYYVLDTLTGECKPTDDFNKVLDKAPSGLISKKKAETIALDALNKGIEGTEYKLSRKDADIVETKLIYKPDGRCDTIFENSPEYVYEVCLTGNTIGVVPEEYSIFVNAKSGKISMINYCPMAN